MTTEFLLLRVNKVRTGGDRNVLCPLRVRVSKHPGQEVWSYCLFDVSVTQTSHTDHFYRHDPQKIGSLAKTCTHAHLTHGQTSREVLQRVCLIRPKLTTWNIVIIISLSYITSFLQHKNRSLTMITLFLNVNIQYLLHFQINLFLIYFVIIIFPQQNIIK